MSRDLPLRPSEGWLTLGLVVLLCMSLAWSLDDANLVVARGEYTDFLAWTAFGGALAGFIGPKVGWRRWTTFTVGAVFAALLTPLMVGMVLMPDGGNLGQLFESTATATVIAWRDLIVLDHLSTQAFGHHLLVLGLIVWGSSMFASYAAFGHRRPINGVILIGVLIVGNMSLTVHDQLGYLVLFSLAALFLLIRFHTFEESSEWLRRRIGDPSAISGMYLRGGTVFIGAAVLGSLVLTTTAKSAPLSAMWTDVGGNLVEWSRAIEKFLPASGSGVSFGPAFGSTAPITGSWTTNDSAALSIEVPADLDVIPHWAAVTYDVFDIQGWRQSDATLVDRPPNTELLANTGDAVGEAGRRLLTVRITPAASAPALSTIFAPSTPVSVDTPTTVKLVGTDGHLASIDRRPSKTPYTVSALIPLRGDGTGASLTQNRLRAAGSDYPADISALYLGLPDGSLGPESKKILSAVKASGARNAYDTADAIVRILQDPSNFTYSTDIRGVDCSGVSVVECFARAKGGYCEYYASTMAVLLRELGIPARFVEGYLPGSRAERSNTLSITNAQSHAWVEVYFPRYGWVTFDPTGGGVGQNTPLPPGELVSSADPGPSSSLDPLASRGPRRSNEGRDPLGGTSTPAGTAGSSGPLIAFALLLGAIVAALAFVAWQRGPRGPVSADDVYGSITRLARRLGFGPRPNQTVYEYAGALAEIVPVARPELELVAHAKVEVAYGGRILGADRLRGLRDAQRRLRLSLLRLAVRRGRRGRARR
jgi:transglutaminase-like putative cysteine protease